MDENTDKKNQAQATHDSLVDALESIKSLLQKSDAKLSAARESIAIASNQTHQGSRNIHEADQLEIPVLDDIVIPAEEASQISDKIEETLKSIMPETMAENIPVLNNLATQPDPQVMLDYLDTLQKQLEKTLRDSLMKSIVTIESGLKKSLTSEIDKIREEIRKDFK
jgi:predicted lipoprotein